MRISVDWYDANRTIILTRFDGRWTWAEFWEAVNHQSDLMDSVDYTVNFISDFSGSRTLPSGAISHAKRLLGSKQHKRAGVSVVVGANALVRNFSVLFDRIYATAAQKHLILFADSYEAAEARLKSLMLEKPGGSTP
jgi:hypothetical protein